VFFQVAKLNLFVHALQGLKLRAEEVHAEEYKLFRATSLAPYKGHENPKKLIKDLSKM
jgi:hypothetical protein